jgi:HEAT repeat protein
VSDRPLTLSAEDARRIAEIEALGPIDGERAIPALVEQLTDRSWAVRRSVVAALAQRGLPAALVLTRVLRDHRDDENRIAAVVDALSASRDPIDELIVDLAADSTAAVLCDVAQILGRRKSFRAVPLLVELTRHADDNVAVAAIEALGRIGGGAGVEALMALVGSGSFFRVFPAIAVLGKSGDSRAVPALLPLLDNAMLIEETVRALGGTADERALPALARLLDGDALRSAATALVELLSAHGDRYDDLADLLTALRQHAGRGASRALAAALPTSEPPERQAITQVLGWLGDDDAIAALFTLVGRTDELGATAASALRRLREAIDTRLALELGAADSGRRLALLPLIGGRDTHLETVCACLEDADPAVRSAACDALAQIGSPRALPPLFQHLGDADPRVAQTAMGAIQSLGSSEAERLTLAAAGSADPAIRRAAYRIIAYFGYGSGLDALLAGTTESDPRLSETAIAGLAYVDDPRALTALLAACASPAAKTRAAAVRALGQCEPAAGIHEAVRAATHDEDPWVRYYACQSIGRHRDEAATPLLVERLGDPAGQVRVSAVEALARAHHPAALAALGEVLGSEDADVRRAALVGLGQSRRPEAIALILSALAADDASTRLVAISSLAVFDAPEVLRALARAGSDPDESVRSAAVELLADRGGALATQLLAGLLDRPGLRPRITRVLSTPAVGRVEGLLAALEHAPPEQASTLAGALARLHQADADAALIELVRAGTPAARRAAAEVLRHVHVPGVREVLELAATYDTDPAVRRAATLALEG